MEGERVGKRESEVDAVDAATGGRAEAPTEAPRQPQAPGPSCRPLTDWQVAHAELVRLAKARAGLDFEEGAWLLAAWRAGAHARLGYASFAEYSERLFGYSPRLTHEKLRVAEALQELPELQKALRAGEMTWSVVRELTRVATPETERAWHDAARSRTARDVERLVSGHRPGSLPEDRADPSARRHILRFEVSAEVLATFREALAQLRRGAGGALDDDATLLLMARHVLGGPSDAGRASYQVALDLCPDCRRARQLGRGEAIDLAPEVAAMVACDAQYVGSFSLGCLSVAADSCGNVAHGVAAETHNQENDRPSQRAAGTSQAQQAAGMPETHVSHQQPETHVGKAASDASETHVGKAASDARETYVGEAPGDASEAHVGKAAGDARETHVGRAASDARETHVGEKPSARCARASNRGESHDHAAGRLNDAGHDELERGGRESTLRAGAESAPRARQDVPPATRRLVLRRDGGRCVVPGCRHATFVDLHHIEPRAEGGGHEPDNLITACSAHHRAIHRGELGVQGRVSTGLRFRHADGTVYGGAVSTAAVELQAQAFRGLRQLGFAAAEARRALLRARAELEPDASLERVLRRALQGLTQGSWARAS